MTFKIVGKYAVFGVAHPCSPMAIVSHNFISTYTTVVLFE